MPTWRSSRSETIQAMTELPLTGGCNCGAVRYEVTEPLVIASYCHCRRCQRRSGAAASPNAHPAEGAFRIVKGHDRLKQWKPEDGGEKWFCGDCGSSMLALLFVALDWTERSIRTGSREPSADTQHLSVAPNRRL